MKIEQIYTGCLAQGAYYIESEGEAVIIDPLREVQPYIARALRNKATIKYVFETHFHADFVSGHLDLAKETGAIIVYGPTAKPNFEAMVATDGQIIPIGKISFKVLHTPGHTMESACFLLRDEEGKDIALFSGDTLFIGDVGRPDLAQKVIPSLTQDILAGYLFDSLREKIMPLADDIIVYPAHGEGSACGKNLSKEHSDTLGHQKATNYALRSNMTKEEFKKEVLSGLVAPPAYFPLNVLMNIKGYESITDVINRGTQALNPDAFEVAAKETTAVILDTRNAATFAKGFVPQAINIGIDGNFAPWVGSLIPDIKQEILLITDPGREEEVVTRLARVGYDYSIGYLKNGFEAWQKAGKPIETIESISANQLADIMEADSSINIVDVRKKTEFDSEHLTTAINAPLDFVNDSMQLIDKNKTGYVQCAGGYRSMAFISILKARGFDKLVNVEGGFKAIKETKRFSITDYMVPVSAL
jgi:glyoxylase-like metal-dependent hydrolase (beta-lactamase superfamily II)/rhodanese-related sulfurtransferase